jgi:cell division protein FtsZ
MIFITSGLGGGTGSGAAPVVASLASELGALTVAVVTKPLRSKASAACCRPNRRCKDLIGAVDTVIVIPNERLMETVERGTSFLRRVRIADDILRQAVQGISDIITVPGIINRDFADVKAIMSGQGYAVMGTAVATGSNRAVDAPTAQLRARCSKTTQSRERRAFSSTSAAARASRFTKSTRLLRSSRKPHTKTPTSSSARYRTSR